MTKKYMVQIDNPKELLAVFDDLASARAHLGELLMKHISELDEQADHSFWEDEFTIVTGVDDSDTILKISIVEVETPTVVIGGE